MPYASLEPAVMGWLPTFHQKLAVRGTTHRDTDVRRCSLQGAGIVAEVFHMANELASSGTGVDVRRAVSVGRRRQGGVLVVGAGLDRRARCASLRRLRRAVRRGRQRRDDAAGDERDREWLRRVHPKTGMIRPIAEGRKVLDAAGIGHATEAPIAQRPS